MEEEPQDGGGAYRRWLVDKSIHRTVIELFDKQK